MQKLNFQLDYVTKAIESKTHLDDKGKEKKQIPSTQEKENTA